MERLAPTSLCTICSVSSRPLSSLRFAFLRRKLCGKTSYFSVPLRISLRSEHDTSRVSLDEKSRSDCDDLWRDSSFVEVIGIGSRKDAVFDFCLESPFQSSCFRFWNIILKDLLEVQLVQRSFGKDIVLRNMEGSALLHPSARTVILVASAGYSLDHITAIELLKTIKSRNGLAVAIVLKPFSFEGQRRQDEVKELVNKLQENTNFCIVVDTDVLLEKEVVTLAEAMKSANNAVLMAMNAISVLMSERYTKLLDTPQNKIEELRISEVVRYLESCKEAKVGFGAGYNIKASVAQAVFDCPFVGGGVKDLNGMIICIVASAGVMDNTDLHNFVHTFRQTTECTREIIISITREPDLEPDLILTTIISLSFGEQVVSHQDSFLSRLAQRFPFVFSILGRSPPNSNNPLPDSSLESPCSSVVIGSSDSEDTPNMNSLDGNSECPDFFSEEPQKQFSSNVAEGSASREYIEDKRREEFIKASADSVSNLYDRTAEGGLTFEREPLISWNVGLGFHIAEEWAKERVALSNSAPTFANQSVYTFPIGVKPSEQSKEDSQFSKGPQLTEPKTLDGLNGKPVDMQDTPTWDSLTDAGVDAVMDIYNAASTLLSPKNVDAPRKQGLLSSRAASMLEAERDSQKKWSPIMEMQYRGGIYKGRCQGGLPEGKGRLTLVDGSIYDGMWRYGKRSGLGTFYYSNGDVFQGTWRDDLMHGKGWFYFHTGDRWFAHFWKGKANGEGRFYSKSGNVFFGNFQDGWRHGNFLCIHVDGTRWSETWDAGTLVSRRQLDSGNSVE